MKKELLSKKAELEDLESSQVFNLAKMRKCVLEGTPRVWLDHHCIRIPLIHLISQECVQMWQDTAETLPTWTTTRD